MISHRSFGSGFIFGHPTRLPFSCPLVPPEVSSAAGKMQYLERFWKTRTVRAGGGGSGGLKGRFQQCIDLVQELVIIDADHTALPCRCAVLGGFYFF